MREQWACSQIVPLVTLFSPDALNAMQKNLSAFQTMVSEKNQEKPSKITLSGNFGRKQSFLLRVFLDFFSTDTLQSAEVFCVDFSALRRFFAAIRIKY